MKKSARKVVSLREAVQALAPLVRSLLQLECDLAGIDRQYSHIPRDCEGPQEHLDHCQRACDRRWAQLVGRAAGQHSSSPGMSSHEECRELLAHLEWLSEIGGATLGTAPLPVTAKIWTAVDNRDPDGVYYDPIPDGAPRTFAGAKYRLTTRVKLRSDGSLASKPRRRSSPEE